MPLDALFAVDQKANPTYPRFYNGGGSRRGAWPGRLEDVSLPVGSKGRAPVGVLDEVPQMLKQNVKLVYNFYHFPVENLGFNEYRSRARTVYFANTIQKNSEDSMGGSLNTPEFEYAGGLT